MLPRRVLFARAARLAAGLATTRWQGWATGTPSGNGRGFSGIYPHLSVAGIHQSENGIGAVVPWAGRLYFITYLAGMDVDGAQRLFEVDDQLKLTPLGEPFYGGSIACRLIHEPTGQLIIGPYLLDRQGRLRQILVSKVMPMHLSAVTRHPTERDQVYFFGLAQERSAVDIGGSDQFLPAAAVTILPRLSVIQKEKFGFTAHHGKGLYSGQGRIVHASNGLPNAQSPLPSGSLMEWDGKDGWQLIRRAQMDEVTGPGGIKGAEKPDDPIWSIGWDSRSALLMVREAATGWHTYRLPKGGYTHDAPSGWYAEWPRIRDVGMGGGRLLMNQNGILYSFPRGFSSAAGGGVRPLATFHKMMVDYAEWDGRIAVGCNDASYFNNALAGRVHSNLLFLQKEELDRYGGRPAGAGGVWLREAVKAGVPSEPYLAAGFDHRVLHLAHEENEAVAFRVQVDGDGRREWRTWRTLEVPARSYRHVVLPPELQCEWLRLESSRDAGSATALLTYSAQPRPVRAELIAGLAAANGKQALSQGILRVTKGEDYPLEFAADRLDAAGARQETGYYRARMGKDRLPILERVDDAAAEAELRSRCETRQEFGFDEASAWVDWRGVRYRLPKGLAEYQRATASGWRRGVREVVTERCLMNVCGTIYELPRDDAGGVRRIRPITTHNLQLFDLASWRGMLVLSGVVDRTPGGGQIIRSGDGKAALWLGNVDDLFHFGHPRGIGGPWRNTSVRGGEPSDAYLMCGYDRKTLRLKAESAATVTLEVDVDASGHWHKLAGFPLQPGRTLQYDFPIGYGAHWLRLVADRDTVASAMLAYE